MEKYGSKHWLYVWTNYWLQKFTVVSNKITKKLAILLTPIFLHGKKLHHFVLLQLWHKVSSDRLWTPLLYPL